MVRIVLSALTFFIFSSVLVFGQDFEVASIRLSGQTPEAQTSAGVHVDGSMVKYSAIDLKLYLGMAFHLKNFQIAAPDWMTSTRWDITAKLPEGSNPTQIPEMLQHLLRDRFQMKMHRETRELPIYGLVIGKTGMKLHESSTDAPPATGAAAGQSVNAAMSNTGTTVTYGNGAYFTIGNNRFEGRKLGMAVMADALSRFADRPVLDMTELKGTYDFSMDFSAEDFRAMMIRAAVAQGATLPPDVLKLADASSGDTLLNAVEKLGLKLESRKAPVEMLVIDDALRMPTEN